MIKCKHKLENNYFRSLCSLVWSDLPPPESAQNGPTPSGSLCHQWHSGDDNDGHTTKDMSEICPDFTDIFWIISLSGSAKCHLNCDCQGQYQYHNSYQWLNCSPGSCVSAFLYKSSILSLLLYQWMLIQGQGRFKSWILSPVAAHRAAQSSQLLPILAILTTLPFSPFSPLPTPTSPKWIKLLQK